MSVVHETTAESPHPGSSSRPSPVPPTSSAPPGRGWRKRKAPPTQPRTQLPVIKQAARDLRTHGTRSEQMIWAALRGSRLSNLKFRRQHPMDRFVLDFYCPEKRLAVEIDGDSHDGREAVDYERQHILESMGIHVIRLPAGLVEGDLAAALAAVQRAAFSNPSPQITGEGSREARG